MSVSFANQWGQASTRQLFDVSGLVKYVLPYGEDKIKKNGGMIKN